MQPTINPHHQRLKVCQGLTQIRSVDPVHVVFDYQDNAGREWAYTGWKVTGILFNAKNAEKWARGNVNDKGVGTETCILTMSRADADAFKARGLLTDREMDRIATEYQMELSE